MKPAIKPVLFALLTVPMSCVVFAASREEFVLTVTLMDPDGTKVVATRVVPEMPFDTSKVLNGARVTIKGELAAKHVARYHLRLTLTEWRSEKNNLRQNCEFDLAPGEAKDFGFVSSFVYQRRILLTPVSSRRVGR